MMAKLALCGSWGTVVCADCYFHPCAISNSFHAVHRARVAVVFRHVQSLRTPLNVATEYGFRNIVRDLLVYGACRCVGSS
jgi:hypothetical protein